MCIESVDLLKYYLLGMKNGIKENPESIKTENEEEVKIFSEFQKGQLHLINKILGMIDR